MENILVIEAHYDDAIFGCFGSLLKLNKKINTNVFIYTICRGRRKDTLDNRRLIANEIYNENKFKFNPVPLFYDLELSYDDINYIVSDLSTIVAKIEPDTILFPKKDLHPDHEICNRIGKILSRPTPKNRYLKNVMEYSILSSDVWNFEMEDTSGYFINVLPDNIAKQRKKYVERFSSELKEFPDLRSSSVIYNNLLHTGYKYGYNDCAEAFKIIYQRRE